MMRAAGRRGTVESTSSTASAKPNVHCRFFPEVGAGGFSRLDGTVAFYTRVNALLRPEMTVLDFGAGRGAALVDEPEGFKKRLRRLQGKVQRVIGVDVDPAVRSNPGLDEAHVVMLERDGALALPLADRSVDLIVADYVFEHVTNPAAIARELDRVLRPHGWLCARTPNRWGYIALASRILPEWGHAVILRRAQPSRRSEDVFPTVYRMNDRATLASLFPSDRFQDFSYTIDPEPAYFGSAPALWRAMLLARRLTPPALGAVRLCFLQKAPEQKPRDVRGTVTAQFRVADLAINSDRR